MTDDPIQRKGLAPKFWEKKPLDRMSRAEWEALCDGCGKCCLNKLEDEDTGDVALTRVACRLLDDSTCHCAHYETRHQFVPDCIVLTPKNLAANLYWIPETCAYKRLHRGQGLADWHPLVSGRAESVHEAGISIQGQTVSEFDVPEDEWDDHVIEEPT